MASRKEELRVDLTATDKASKVIDEVATAVEGLDGDTADVTISATDKATADVQSLMTRISGLTDDEKKVILTAEAKKLESEVQKALLLLGKVDGEEATAILEAKDLASTKLAAVDSELTDIDGRIATATLEATDHASDDTNRVDGKLDAIDGRTARATIDANEGAGLSGLLDDVGGMPGNIGTAMSTLSTAAGPTGAIGLAAAATAALVTQAAEWGTEVGEVATLTGDSVEDVSAFLTVWKGAGFEKGDLLDIVAQMVGVLDDSPGIAEDLGIALDGSMTPLEMLRAAIVGLNSDQLSANDRILLGSKLFGEEGVRQINRLVTVVEGDLTGAIEDVPEALILSDEQVAKAIELKAQFAEVSLQIQAITGELGQALLPPLTAALGIIREIEDATGVNILEAMVPTATVTGTTAALEDAATALGELGLARDEVIYPLIQAWDELVADLADNGEIDTATGALDLLANATGREKDEVVELAGGMGEAVVAVDDATDSAADHQAAIDEEIASLEAEKTALEEATAALDARLDALTGLAEGYYAERDAVRDAEDAVTDYTAAEEEGFESDSDRQASLDKVAQAHGDVATAVVESARQEAIANGTTLSRTQLINIENQSLLTQAATLEGPVQQAVLAHVLRINGIPEQRITEILTDTDPNDLAQTKAELDGPANVRRVAAIEADANDQSVADVERALAYLARPRYATVHVSGGGGIGAGQYAVATGTSYSRGGMALVGEHGPELVSLPAGSRVSNDRQTAEALQNAQRPGAVFVYNITQNLPAGTRAADVAASLRRQERWQGPAA